jgi:hypothetical protein
MFVLIECAADGIGQANSRQPMAAFDSRNERLIGMSFE